MNNNCKIHVFGFVFGSGKRLIATVETDIQAENIYRRWKSLNTAQRLEWVRGMQVVKQEVAA